MDFHHRPSASFLDRRRTQLALTGNPPPADRQPYQPHLAAHLTLATLLLRGWKRTTIEALLGDPDRLRANPHHEGAAPMRLYLTARVNAAERSPEFWSLQAGKRKRAARPSSR